MSSRGQIVIPQAVRERCRLGEGDHFVIEDDPERQVVTLRKVKRAGQWFDVYMDCPHPFDPPPRKKQFYRRKDGLAG
ncbi:MAG: AbrB/MazE/SpoVT family DNA-binding domain-containing protein [Verrucomicrobia bacterium]|nr:AbrB/MazE/SpoVT family DNA-binding domain-containing protein [Verrucomicrobiota bacterium]